MNTSAASAPAVPAAPAATPVAALGDLAGAGPGAPSDGVRGRAREQESFAADVFAGVHRIGEAGTVLVVCAVDDLARRPHVVEAVSALARELIVAGHGIQVSAPGAPVFAPGTPPDRRAALLTGVVAVVSTTAALDPDVVPAEVPVLAWVLDHGPRWLAQTRLQLFDEVLGGSSTVLERLRRRLRGSGTPLALVAPRADTDTYLREPSGAAVDRRWVTVIARRPVGAFAVPLLKAAETGRLRIHAPRACVPPTLHAHRRPPLLAIDRPVVYENSLAVVFLEPQPADVADGIVALEIIEAAASGAVPVTRTRLGLAAAGLAEATSFVSPATLGRCLEDLIEDPGRTRARGARLAAVVAARPPLALWPRPIAPRRATLGFFPDLRITNPYQDMLYGGLAGIGMRAAPVRDALESVALREGAGRLEDYVFHLHWTSAIAQDGLTVFDAATRVQKFMANVTRMRARGGRLVWTVHNVLPHELRYRDLELKLCRWLAATADLIHVMNARTVAATAPFYSLPPERTVVVPHASYLGWYPQLVTRADARRRLGLREHEVALLALGGVRPYRGLDRLLDVFDELSAADPRLRLLVAGRPGPGPAVRETVLRCEAHPRILTQFRYVPPHMLQVWNSAADLAVLPYRAILNSGAFQLAQSFGLPVVAPRDGSLLDSLDPVCTVGFDPTDLADLHRATRAGIDLVEDPGRAAAAHRAALAAAAAYSPPAMAADFARALVDSGLVRGLVPDPVPDPVPVSATA